MYSFSEIFTGFFSICLVSVRLRTIGVVLEVSCIGSEAVLTGKHTCLKHFVLIRSIQLGTEASGMFGIDFIENNT